MAAAGQRQALDAGAEAVVPHPHTDRDLCPYEDGDGLACCRDSRGSLADCLRQAPILASRFRSSRSGMLGPLHVISILNYLAWRSNLRCCPMGGGGGGEGIWSRSCLPMFALWCGVLRCGG